MKVVRQTIITLVLKRKINVLLCKNLDKKIMKEHLLHISAVIDQKGSG